jgi:hypothetical protein
MTLRAAASFAAARIAFCVKAGVTARSYRDRLLRVFSMIEGQC